MLLGTREPFSYFVCPDCGCLQIDDVPQDLAPYYPPDAYYSLGERPTWPWTMPVGAIMQLDPQRAAAYLGDGGDPLLGALAERALQFYLQGSVDPAARILDVGCGNGAFIRALASRGFTKCAGVDPFATELSAPGIELTAETIERFAPRRRWDLIMFNHSFEHVPDPRASLAAAARRLAKRGRILLRMPVADSPLFDTYQRDWALLDAPRHLFIHCRESLDRLAAAVGLTVCDVVFDSTGFSLWGSEQNRRDIAFMEPRSVVVSPFRSPFSTAQLVGFEARAAALNAAGTGDQAGFVLAAE